MLVVNFNIWNHAIFEHLTAVKLIWHNRFRLDAAFWFAARPVTINKAAIGWCLQCEADLSAASFHHDSKASAQVGWPSCSHCNTYWSWSYHKIVYEDRY